MNAPKPLNKEKKNNFIARWHLQIDLKKNLGKKRKNKSQCW